MNLKHETVKDLLEESIKYAGRLETLKIVQKYYGDIFLRSAINKSVKWEKYMEANSLLHELISLIENNDL